MNRILFLLISMLGVSAIVHAQFEGVIDLKVTDHDTLKPVESTYRLFVKGEMLATELKGESQEEQHGKFIFRSDKKVFWIVNDQEKSFIEISVKDDGKSSKHRTDGGKKQANSGSRLKKIGKTEIILGYVCDEMVAEDGSRVAHIWSTKKLGNVYEGLMKTFGRMAETSDGDESDDWEAELSGMKVFPLKIVTSQDGRLRETQQVTKIEPKTVDASLFEPPASYKKQSLEFDMQKMLKGMDGEMKQSKELGAGNKEKNKNLEKMMKDMDKSMKNLYGADSIKDDEDKDDDDDEDDKN